MDYIDLIEEEDIQHYPNLVSICNECGIDFVRNLIRIHGGFLLYIPNLRNDAKFIKKCMKHLNKTQSPCEIARSLNLREQYVRKLLKDK